MTRRRLWAAFASLSILTALLAMPGLSEVATAAHAKRPKVSVGDASVTETDGPGVVATFDVKLINGNGGTVKVWWTTKPGSASADDFTAASGKLLFKGSRAKQTKHVHVAITGDNAIEADETFHVVLTKISGAKAKGGDGTGTIVNDDAEHTLTVAPTGNGSGTVTSSPAGISCPGDCAQTYPGGTAVTLTAVPAVSSTFTGWSGGGCSGTGTCVTTVNAGTTVVPTFTLKTFALTVGATGTGSGSLTSTPAGISCPADCSELYNYGTVVTVAPLAASNSLFTGWGGACSGTGSCVVTMTAARSVTATFTAAPTLSVAKVGNGSGTVTSSPSGINCGATCTKNYLAGTVVTLTATAATGTTFAGWSGGGCSGTGTCTVTVNSFTAVTANFNLITYFVSVTVTQNGGSNGKVISSPVGISCGAGTTNDCNENYTYGTVLHLNSSAGAGFNLAGWSAGPCQDQGTNCTFTVTGPASVTATFNSL
jgi:hypothetical protein